MADSAVLTPERSTPSGARPAASRTVRRRQSLPSGRAVIGGFLVAAAALGIYVAWARATAGPTARYVVAARDLAVGSHIAAGDLALVPMDLPPRVAARAAFRDPARLVGATVVGPIHADELVQAGDVVRGGAGPDALEISFGVDASRALAGHLAEGETVDVDATSAPVPTPTRSRW
ncbi:MAG TPA: SAF domain-containing protein [Acidimicrobiales bacterium]|nr:SAF domain-containing protein [Acidimicrobiales bacterium]